MISLEVPFLTRKNSEASKVRRSRRELAENYFITVQTHIKREGHSHSREISREIRFRFMIASRSLMVEISGIFFWPFSGAAPFASRRSLLSPPLPFSRVEIAFSSQVAALFSDPVRPTPEPATAALAYERQKDY